MLNDARVVSSDQINWSLKEGEFACADIVYYITFLGKAIIQSNIYPRWQGCVGLIVCIPVKTLIAIQAFVNAMKSKNWKQEDFIRTFNTGVLPDGRQLGPTMSSETFNEMNEMELAALWLYFTSAKP